MGEDFGTGNAQYTSLAEDEDERTVVLGLGATYTPIGTVNMLRVGSDLQVTISTNLPYLMDENHLYVGAVPPVNSAPGLFPYQYTVGDPANYFTSHTFTVDVSAIAGTNYVAAHARVLELV